MCHIVWFLINQFYPINNKNFSYFQHVPGLHSTTQVDPLQNNRSAPGGSSRAGQSLYDIKLPVWGLPHDIVERLSNLPDNPCAWLYFGFFISSNNCFHFGRVYSLPPPDKIRKKYIKIMLVKNILWSKKYILNISDALNEMQTRCGVSKLTTGLESIIVLWFPPFLEAFTFLCESLVWIKFWLKIINLNPKLWLEPNFGPMRVLGNL